MLDVLEYYVGPDKKAAEKVLAAVKADPGAINPAIQDRYGDLTVTFGVTKSETKERIVSMLFANFPDGFVC